jgi:hypothetical protein
MALTNRDRVLECINKHPDGIDDDQISTETKITPRQQIYQLATRLAQEGSIRRESVVKPGKRRKIHNFPLGEAELPSSQRLISQETESKMWKRRLAALVAATGQDEGEILDRALKAYARNFLKEQTD